MDEQTEQLRREQLIQVNSEAGVRSQLEERHGQVWNTEELGRDFEVVGFAAPFVVVLRRSDGVKGSLTFQHSPRFYFDFVAD